jgi:hypothetical protein
MKRFTKVIVLFAIYGMLAAQVPTVALAQQTSPPNNGSRIAGRFTADSYAYGISPVVPGFRLVTGNVATGSQTVTINAGALTLPDGRLVYPFSINAPVIFDVGANAETLTPSAVSGCTSAGQYTQTCSITATFVNLHSAGALLASGTAGLQEAIYDAYLTGGGLVQVGSYWATQLGGTTAMLNAAIPYPNVAIEDVRANAVQYWNTNPSTLTAIGTPIALTSQAACDATHQFCSDANVVGTWANTGALFGCVAYVDIMGNEGACSPTSTTFNNTNLKAIDVLAPAASTGAVGYTIYLSLSGGTYALAYQVPITSSICTLTTLETVTPACAVANATYGQSASTFGANTLFKGGAQIAATVVNTAPHFAGGLSTATSYAAAVTAHTTFGYTPGTKIATQGIQASYGPFAAVATTATTIPGALGAINLPAGFMNYIGKSIRVSGKIAFTNAATSSQQLGLFWDAALSDAATVPVVVCNFNTTETGTAAAFNISFSCILTTNSTGTTGTMSANGVMVGNLAAPTTAGITYTTPDIAIAASATVNLTVPARLAVIEIPTGATPTAFTLQTLNLEVLN